MTNDGAGLWVAAWDSWDSLINMIGLDYDIMVTTDEAGNWVAVWESQDPPIGVDLEILIASSTDAGATWTVPTALSTSTAIQDHFPEVMTDVGSWVAVWYSPDRLNGSIALERNILASIDSLIEILIDIKPGSDPNSINLKSKGIIPVAILTTDDFDATTVYPLSVQFGPSGATEVHGNDHMEDVDDDGDIDLVFHFKTQETGIACGDVEAGLTGETFNGQAIEGFDTINIITCD